MFELGRLYGPALAPKQTDIDVIIRKVHKRNASILLMLPLLGYDLLKVWRVHHFCYRHLEKENGVLLQRTHVMVV